MTEQIPFIYNSPIQVLEARKKYLLAKQKNSVDLDELVSLKRGLDEVEYLLSRYEDSTNRSVEKVLL